ncbi:hypothetical protein HG536_0H03040 [Torulaspora globosa]|uniref:CCA tRNA nucleotidyltransferase, mitochondrial n=1 Tax=Torulaspora globosa TaxID=48254 RepID=A0A7G3ZN43_9SACH|nr:uncharacterized protein HG536_0H03040 [Torulaspora globosa]QLL34929.1 hypothetical protein HG536_0H03040 [Torulaspora globosa]
MWSTRRLWKWNLDRVMSSVDSCAVGMGLPSFRLDKVERGICGLLNDFTREYNERNKLKEPLTLRISGGWVRDKILGRESHDLDISINVMSGEQFATQLSRFLTENFDKYGVKPHSVHKIGINPAKSKHLETATTKLFGVEVDFVNLRSEEYSDHSRIPVTKFGTAREDALRRDATLNALFYNIQLNRVEDFTGTGLQDLKNGILRTPLPPRQTFLDDPLRVLRLIRFASRYNFRIEDSVLKEMQDPEINAAFSTKVSNERIGTEVEKILEGPNPLLGLALIQKTHIENVVFSWHHDVDLINFNKQHCKDLPVIDRLYDDGVLNAHLCKVVENFESFVSDLGTLSSLMAGSAEWKRSFILSACLMPMEGLKIIWTTRKTMNNTMPAVESILKDGLKIGKNGAAQVSRVVDSLTSYEQMIKKFSEDRAQLSRSDIGIFLRSLKGDWQITHFVSLFKQYPGCEKRQLVQVMEQYASFYDYVYAEQLENCHDMKPLINGKEMVSLLKMKGGPWLGKINDRAIMWQLDHPSGTSEELLDYVKSILPEYT